MNISNIIDANIVIVNIVDTESPRWNFFMWIFFNISHKGLPNMDRTTAMAKYRNISGKKYINVAKANIPAIGFM